MQKKNPTKTKQNKKLQPFMKKRQKNVNKFNDRDSLTSWHKITTDGLTGVKINQSNLIS